MVLTLASLIENGIPISLGCAAVGLVFALWLIKSLLAIPAGTEKMQFIANAIEQGAKAYLARQLASIAVIGVIIALLLFWKKDAPTAVGFIVGAICSLAAGFIGMRVAVKANVRTAEGARSRSRGMIADRRDQDLVVARAEHAAAVLLEVLPVERDVLDQRARRGMHVRVPCTSSPST